MRAALLTLSVWSALCNCQSIGCGQSLSECTLYTPSKKACNRSSNCNQASHRPAPKCLQNKSGGWSDESGCHAIADGRRDCPPQVDGEDPHRGSDIIDPRPGGQARDRTATKCQEAGVPVDAGLVGPRALERRIAAIERLADTAAATTCGCSATAVTRSDRSCESGATASTTAASSSAWPS